MVTLTRPFSLSPIEKEFVEKYPLEFRKSVNTIDDIEEITSLICAQFKKLVENNGLNKLLYDGKKFVGDESAFKDNIFIETTVITLNYSNEKEIFDKLTGEHALKRGITGIIEETNSFSREQFIEIFTKLYKNAIVQL